MLKTFPHLPDLNRLGTSTNHSHYAGGSNLLVSTLDQQILVTQSGITRMSILQSSSPAADLRVRLERRDGGVEREHGVLLRQRAVGALLDHEQRGYAAGHQLRQEAAFFSTRVAPHLQPSQGIPRHRRHPAARCVAIPGVGHALHPPPARQSEKLDTRDHIQE